MCIFGLEASQKNGTYPKVGFHSLTRTSRHLSENVIFYSLLIRTLIITI